MNRAKRCEYDCACSRVVRGANCPLVLPHSNSTLIPNKLTPAGLNVRARVFSSSDIFSHSERRAREVKRFIQLKRGEAKWHKISSLGVINLSGSMIFALCSIIRAVPLWPSWQTLKFPGCRPPLISYSNTTYTRERGRRLSGWKSHREN